MKVAPFRYHRPDTLASALDLLAELGDDAKVLAGGQSLMPMLSYRLATPAHLVDLARVPDLAGWSIDDGGRLCIRAMARQRDVELDPDIGLHVPMLHSALSNVAHVQIRNRGTVCGSLAHADPAAELPAAMVALDATMVVESTAGQRHLPASEFFLFHFTTALEPGEILREVQVPAGGPDRLGAFREISHRTGDFALVGVAAVVDFAGEVVSGARIVCSGVSTTPFRAVAAEAAVVGHPLADEVLVRAQAATPESMAPTDDFHADSGYRRHVAGVLVRRCLLAIRDERGAIHGN